MSLKTYYRFIEKNPWYECWRSARRRCIDVKHKSYTTHGARGIKCFLTKEDAKFLWDRDQAHTLRIPSIDRIDPDKDYTVTNCRFIEFTENCGRTRSKWRKETPIEDSKEAVANWG